MSGSVNPTPNPAPQGPPAPPPSGSTPPPASGGPAPRSGGSAQATAAQASAAVGNVVSTMRQRLVAGEQLVMSAAASIVVIVYLVFQFLLNYYIVSDFAVVMAVLAILAIWLHRWGQYDFGKPYRIIIGALGLSLALFAVINFLAWVRVGGESAGFLHLLGRIIYWVSGLAAGYGAWLVFRLRED